LEVVLVGVDAQQLLDYSSTATALWLNSEQRSNCCVSNYHTHIPAALSGAHAVHTSGAREWGGRPFAASTHTSVGLPFPSADTCVPLQNLRMYFVPVLNDGSGTEPYQVDLQQLYCFFTDSKQLRVVPIQPLSDNIQDPVLRIRWGFRQSWRGREAAGQGCFCSC
jgi:hypothetical protein